MLAVAKRSVSLVLDQHFPRLSLELRLLRNRHFEPEMKLMRLFTNDRESVVDVGANAGHYSYFLAKSARSVFAFEPNVTLIPALERLLPDNVTLYPIGLSDKSGFAVLRFDPGNTGIGTVAENNTLQDNPGIRSIVTAEVSLERLDAIIDVPVSLVKIDVEGHEEAVLAGASGVIDRDQPTFLIEIEERHAPGALARIADQLGSLGYSGYFLREGRLWPVAVFDSGLQQTENLYTGEEYINNFIFVPERRLHDLPLVQRLICAD